MVDIKDKNTAMSPTGDTRMSTARIIKNLVVMCLGFLFLFSAYNPLIILQSSMNQEHGIGVASQALTYAAFGTSAILLPKFAIKRLGCKNALLFSMVCYLPFSASNFYFVWATMVPSAILVGLAAAILWSSQSTYFNKAAVLYACRTVQRKCCGENTLSANSEATATESHTKQEVMLLPISLERTDGKGNADLVRSSYSSGIHAQDPTSDSGKPEKESQLKTANETTLNLQRVKESDDANRKKVKAGSQESLSSPQNKSTLENDTPDENSQFKTIPKNVFLSRGCEKTDNEGPKKGKAELYESSRNASQKYPTDQTTLEVYIRTVSSVTAIFFGFFGLAYRAAEVLGNLVSYFVLQKDIIPDNSTGIHCICGAYYCNEVSGCYEQNLAEPDQELKNTLSGICVALGCLGIIVVYFFLEDIEEAEEKKVGFSLELAMSTCKFALRKEAMLLIPFSMYIGFMQSFYMADYTKAFVSCAWGVYHVGLVAIAAGVSAAVFCSISGLLVKFIGRIAVLLLGEVLNLSVIVFFLLWDPSGDSPGLLLLGGALWGAMTGILWSQLRAYYGVIFKGEEEAAFSCFYLWDAIGYCVGFSYSNYLCVYVKLYILVVISIIGTLGYLRTEFMHKK